MAIGWASLLGILVALASWPAGAAPPPIQPVGNLDCHGDSKVQQPLLPPFFSCPDFHGRPRTRGEDNHHYIGHDEPSVSFISSAPGSGSNMQWQVTLPAADPALPGIQTFQLYATFWFGLVLCDPNSFPQGACTPDSDKNKPTKAGAAFLELQLYPPGLAFGGSCDTVHWCAALTIDSFTGSKAVPNGNPNCAEPVNFAFIQTDGVPTGPPGPNTATNASFAPNGNTLLMNPGDQLQVTIMDTPNGLETLITDLTTTQSGFMVASADNHFQNTDPETCAGTDFAFRPEFSTARLGNILSWGSELANVEFSFEIGHFETADGDDADDGSCTDGPVLPGCYNADLDFDGFSYQLDWPGTPHAAVALPSSVVISSPLGNGIGPLSLTTKNKEEVYAEPYAQMIFQTSIIASEDGCKVTGKGCVLPPVKGAFYPFYAVKDVKGKTPSCTMIFGDFSGTDIVNFGGIKQYGTPYVPLGAASDVGPVKANPCIPIVPKS